MKYGADPLRADRFEEARKQLVEVERHLGRIRVSCTTTGAEVTLDAAPLFTGPGQREIWVTARAHEVTAKKADFGTQARRVAVAPGAQEAVELTLRKMVLEDPPKWKYWTLVAAGAGVAAASGVLHGLSAHDFSTFDSGFAKLSCSTIGCKPNEIDSQLSSRLNRARLEQKIRRRRLHRRRRAGCRRCGTAVPRPAAPGGAGGYRPAAGSLPGPRGVQ